MDPMFLSPKNYVWVFKAKPQHGFHNIPVRDTGQMGRCLEDIISLRDTDFLKKEERGGFLEEIMTRGKKDLVVASAGITLNETNLSFAAQQKEKIARC